MLVAMLTDVQSSEVESERLNLPKQVGQATRLGNLRSLVLQKAVPLD